MNSNQPTSIEPSRRRSPPHAAKSFWLRDYGDYTPNGDLDGSVDCDVLIIGGGVAGISTALHAARDGLGKVVLIESEIVGFGATGRSAGWIMPQFGMDQLSIHAKYGHDKSRAAFAYCNRAVAYTRELIEQYKIDSDYRHPGLMRVAFDDRWIDDLRTLFENYRSIGMGDITWIEGTDLQEQFNGNVNFRAAISDPNLGLLNPCKQVRALKRLAENVGAEIYENTPAVYLERVHGGVLVDTPRGAVRAAKIVVATNAFSHMLEGPIGRDLRRVQSPVFARGAVTEKLSDEQWRSIGWTNQNAIESSLELFHYMAPTIDGRIQFFFIYYGGHPVRGEMEPTISRDGGAVSLAHLKRIFPPLRDIRLEQNWGGHMSGTRDLIPQLSQIGDERVIYIGGCWGHGLAISHLHGQTVSHMLQGKTSDLTDFWIVNRKPRQWPPFPLDYFGKRAVWEKLKRRTRAQMQSSIFDIPIQ